MLLYFEISKITYRETFCRTVWLVLIQMLCRNNFYIHKLWRTIVQKHAHIFYQTYRPTYIYEYNCVSYTFFPVDLGFAIFLTFFSSIIKDACSRQCWQKGACVIFHQNMTFPFIFCHWISLNILKIFIPIFVPWCKIPLKKKILVLTLVVGITTPTLPIWFPFENILMSLFPCLPLWHYLFSLQFGSLLNIFILCYSSLSSDHFFFPFTRVTSVVVLYITIDWVHSSQIVLIRSNVLYIYNNQPLNSLC